MTQDQMTKLTTQIMHLKVCGSEFLWFLQSFKMSECVSLLNSSSSSYLYPEGNPTPS